MLQVYADGNAAGGGGLLKSLLRQFLKWIRTGLEVAFWGYSAVLILALIFVDLVGERNVTSAFLLFLPQQGWILPYLALVPVCLLVHWWLLLRIALVAVFFVFGYMDWQVGVPAGVRDGAAGDGQSDTLTVLSFNRGQQAGSLRPFKNRVKPDVLVLQDAPHRAGRFLRAEGYSEFSHGESIGEFTLLSRHPITAKKLVRLPGDLPNVASAARFEIDFLGRRTVVYSVHLPTPRDVLLYYRRGAFLYGVLGLPGTPWAEKRRDNQEYWDRRIAIARALVEQVGKEEYPYLVVGDFNTPDHGYIYRIFSTAWEDAHEEAGVGFGFTFPGTTRNPLSLFGPWLRLDYLFSGGGWKTVASWAEPSRPSQHRAVAATFQLQKKGE